MANLVISHVLLVAGLVLLVGAEANVDVFKALQKDVFGEGHTLFYESLVEKKIQGMIRFIEGGSIPAEVQGEQTLEYLQSLIDDCKTDECNLDEDLKRIQRLREQNTTAPNLDSYLKLCYDRRVNRCESEMGRHVREGLSSVDNKTMKAVDALSERTFEDLLRRSGWRGFYQENPAAPNDVTVLKALNGLDPAGSKAMLKKWTGRKAALEEFMDQIRLPCTEFIKHVDSRVKFFPSNYLYSGAGKLHYYLNTCEKVIHDWKSILDNAYNSYQSQLVAP